MRKATTIITTFIACLVTALGVLALTGDTEHDCPDMTVVVTYGDTLWSIAEEHCTGNLQSAVDELVDTHNTTSLQVGDIVTLGKGDMP